MDKLDRAIIDQLQDHGRLTNQELADRVGLTPAPCLRRVRRLEAELVAKDLATVASFEERLVAMDEVAELRRMFGIPDYFIRVQTADLAAYEQWLSVKLMGDPAIARVDSRLTMKLLKSRR
ncbi:Lrp/AsnC family transcriptional regulator [Mycobacteroides abscessus]|uniref:Lrp/AsnC family transcriptional regulator n=1 Tax=Mycobacteroides abscessus TaxID=36809 RepID=UPI000C264696|nr:Lrp/AsnC family transcriptional regulator [Mycobacteroides abscessus]